MALPRYIEIDAYPALYADDVRHDDDHLNDRGSRRFAELLSQDFIKTNPVWCRG